MLSLGHRANVTLNLNKCKIFRKKVDHLGYVILPSRLELTFHTTEVIHDSRATSNSKPPEGIHRFMQCMPALRFQLCPSCCLTYRHFKTQEQKKFDHFSTGRKDALGTLQQNIIVAPVLAFPRAEGYLMLYIDLWKNQIGCVLVHNQSDGLKNLV